jgi:hypothetical protein
MVTGCLLQMSGDDSYLKIVRSLQRPTASQTALFATYVADAHSWYKHLPVHKMVPFHFFIDPHAGMYFARDTKGRTTMRAIEDTEGHIHYTAQKTDDYLRRFGFWNYDAKYGTALLYRVGDQVADTRPRGPRIVNNEGKLIPVSTDVLELGRAEVNAFVHRHPSLHIWEMRLRDGRRQGGPSTGFPLVESCLKRLASGPHISLAPLPSSVQKRIDKRGYIGSLWDEENMLDKLLDLVPGSNRAKEEVFPALLEHLESKRTRQELEYILRIIRPSESVPTDLIDQFHGLLFPERLRQLRALHSALNRVIEFVYGATESRSTQ